MGKNKLLLILAVLVCIAGTAAEENSKKSAADLPSKALKHKASSVKWHNSYTSAVGIAKSENKPLFVDFTAEWCGWCDKLEKEVLSHPEIITKLEDFVCVRIDVGKNRRLAYEFGVTSLPRTMVINTHSEIVGDWLGYRERTDFSKLLGEVKEYARTETGAVKVPDITAAGPKLTGVEKITVDVSSRQSVFEQLARKEPEYRKSVIDKLSADPDQAKVIGLEGLESKYLGVRIASWELLKKIKQASIKFDPWASTGQRKKMLELLQVPVHKTEAKTVKPTERPNGEKSVNSAE